MTTRSLLLAGCVAAALLATSPVRAENLVEVYQAAVRSDPVLREAEARRSAALELKPQARGLLLPQVNLAGQYATRESDSESTFTQRIDTDNDPNTPGVIVPVPNTQQADADYWNYDATLTQSLFRWDQWQALKRADAQVAVAEATYRAAQQNLLVRVSTAYFDVLAAEDTLGAAQATLEALTRQLEQADKRFEVGLIAITDVQEARAAHDNATAGVIAATAPDPDNASQGADPASRTLRLHKTLAWVHGAGMVLMPILGVLAANPQIFGLDPASDPSTTQSFQRALRSVHTVVGYATFATFSVSAAIELF